MYHKLLIVFEDSAQRERTIGMHKSTPIIVCRLIKPTDQILLYES